MANSVLDNFIGKGLIFPLRLNDRGAAELGSGLELIRTSLANTLQWPKGNRYFLHEYGSRLPELLEEPNDIILEGLLKTFIIETINNWEKRIELVSSDIVHVDDYKVSVQLTYRLKQTKIEDTFVFPFYRNLIY